MNAKIDQKGKNKLLVDLYRQLGRPPIKDNYLYSTSTGASIELLSLAISIKNNFSSSVEKLVINGQHVDDNFEHENIQEARLEILVFLPNRVFFTNVSEFVEETEQ